jgi:S1-C subfamily serine protease
MTKNPRLKRVFICVASIFLIGLFHCDLAVAQSESTEEPCNAPLTSIFKQVSPAVVFITAVSINPYRMNDRVEHVVGSGFIIDNSGLILTNAHVVFGRQLIVVTLDDGSAVPAQLVGADPIFDLAILKIPKPTEGTLNVVPLGNSDRVQVGEEVIAIGNPLGIRSELHTRSYLRNQPCPARDLLQFSGTFATNGYASKCWKFWRPTG